jgi:photosystem II stability/assembly factor-like uncharacterized protein
MSILVSAVLVITLTLVTLGRALSLAAEGETKKAGQGADYIHTLAMDAEARTMFLGTHFGLFRSFDGGRSWKMVSLPTRQPHLDILAISPDPKHATTIYVSTHQAGVLKSTDGGTTWKESSSGLSGLDIHGLTIDTVDVLKLHAAVRGKGEEICRSTDGGEKWIRLHDGPSGQVRTLASVKMQTRKEETYLYAGTTKGLQRRADYSRSWQPVSGLPANRAVNGFAVDQGTPGLMYVAMQEGLFLSTDAGLTWKSVGQGLVNLTAVVVNPKRPTEVYALSGDGFVFKSVDRGTTWELLK